MGMAQMKVIKEDETVTLHCTGEWNALNLEWIVKALPELGRPLHNMMITFELGEVMKFDTAGALLLHKCIRTLEENGNEVTLRTKDDTMEHMLQMVREHAHPETSFLTPMPGMLESVGVATLEFIDEDRVLVLLRDYSYLNRHLIITLLSVDFSNGDVDTLLKMDSQKGWKIDNFEGLTKVGENLYLMVSDDNESMFQKTLFVLFEIL